MLQQRPPTSAARQRDGRSGHRLPAAYGAQVADTIVKAVTWNIGAIAGAALCAAPAGWAACDAPIAPAIGITMPVTVT